MHRSSTQPFAIALVVVLLAGLFACAAPPDRPTAPETVRYIRIPEVDLSALRGESSAAGQQFWIDLQVHNPNRFALNVMGVDVELNIDGTRIVRGLSNDAVQVPAQGTLQVAVPARVAPDDAARLDARLRLSGANAPQALAYSVAGRLYLGNNNGISSVPFARSAQLRQRSP